MAENKPTSIDETIGNIPPANRPFVVPRAMNYFMGAGFAVGLALVVKGNAEENVQLEYFGAGIATYSVIYAASVHFISPLIAKSINHRFSQKHQP